MDLLSESEDNMDYNSDEIDSETETQLYGAIHHSLGTDAHKVAEESHRVAITSSHRPSNATLAQKSDQSVIGSNRRPLMSKKPLSDLFHILDNRFAENEDNHHIRHGFGDRKAKTIECIQIDDSSDEDSLDVRIIDEWVKTSNETTVGHKKSSPKALLKSDISLGNVNNLSESTLSAIESMNRFYDEDVYDTEEEEKSIQNMRKSKHLWKISHKDLLMNKTTNRYYKSRFICHNCKERGHRKHDCPQPRKPVVCYLCGLCGHPSAKCERLLQQYRRMNCDLSANQLHCDICGLRGHESNQCTYNWRKYHLTTTSTSEEPIISNLSPNGRKCCYNCGAFGKHFGFECRSKSLDRHMIPVSPLMPNLRESHCFNGSNNRRNDNNKREKREKKALYNEFAKSISSNELSCRLSASFNKPLDGLHLIHTSASATAIHTTSATARAATASAATVPLIGRNFNYKNKHMKWIYPQRNDSLGHASDSTAYTIELCPQHKAIEEHRKRGIFSDSSLILDACALNSAHTLTAGPSTQAINNSKRRQRQKAPQVKERLKRRKRRHIEKSREIGGKQRKYQLLRETNITENHLKNTFNRRKGLNENSRRWNGQWIQ